MFWQCLKASDDDGHLVKSSDVELLPTTHKFVNRLTTEDEVFKDKKSSSQSFSTFAWSALKDMSLPQVFESSQTYIQSQLRNFHHVYSLKPPNQKQITNPSVEDRDVVWPLMSPLIASRSNDSLERSSSLESRSKADSISSDNSMPKSLVDHILDDYDKLLMTQNVNGTTDDGFGALSRHVMSSSSSSRTGICRKDSGEENERETMLKIITTNDGMRQLACDSMKLSKRKERSNGGHVHRHEREYEYHQDEDKDGEEGAEGCVREEEWFNTENQRMLRQFNLDVMQSNVTPDNVSPISPL